MIFSVSKISHLAETDSKFASNSAILALAAVTDSTDAAFADLSSSRTIGSMTTLSSSSFVFSAILANIASKSFILSPILF